MSEKKNSSWHIIVAIVFVVLGVYLLVSPDDKPSADGAVRPQVSALVADRPTFTAQDVERLSEDERKLTTVITVAGKGAHAKWGIKKSGTFVLTSVIECRSKVLSKKKTPVGDIEVTEERTYGKVAQMLKVSDADVTLALGDCLPLDKVADYCAAVVAASAGVDSALTREAVSKAVDALDKASVRKVLGMMGNTGKMLQEDLNAFVGGLVRNEVQCSDLSGKSYIVTYYQEPGDGRLSNMRLAHKDGTTDLSEEEVLFLRRANVFMDSQLMPDRTCKPGHVWTVCAADFDCLLDPYVEGSYDGDIRVMRNRDDAQGHWVLGVAPGMMKIKTKDKTTGYVKLNAGQIHLDGKTLEPLCLQLSGTAAMQNLTRHHLLFKAKIEGDCTFDAKMSTR